MKILLTGATGYIGKRLLPTLVAAGYDVVCGVRDPDRLQLPKSLLENVGLIRLDLLDEASFQNIPDDIEGAYYLVHSMSSAEDFAIMELECASNFRKHMSNRKLKQLIYLSGIVNETELSDHLLSRKNVEEELAKGDYALTTLRAGIIVGSGSASFEIIRDLVEKLPVMVAPKWLHTKSQPIAVNDVIQFLLKSLFHEKTYHKNFDIGGPDVLSYKEMLLQFAEVRKLGRTIVTVPVMTPRLSSYWLYFVTSTSYMLAVALVKSMRVEVLCRDNSLQTILGIEPISYKEAIERAFRKIKSNSVVSSWKDAYISSGFHIQISDFIKVPEFGCYKDKRSFKIDDRAKTLQKIWNIGGNTGWYYANWLWRIRGVMDKWTGGVGLRRGRTHDDCLEAGDALDFWRVLYANKEEGRLLLFAEMKVPGEAWLEFRIEGDTLHQVATFRPLGLLGRLYWFSVLPFHEIVFRGMGSRIAQ